MTKTIDLVRVRSTLERRKLVGFKPEVMRSKIGAVKVGKPKEGFTKSGKSQRGKVRS